MFKQEAAYWKAYASFTVLLFYVNVGLGRNCTKLDSCSCQFDDGSGIVDLSGVAKHGSPLIFDAQVGRYHYSFNPCFPFQEGPDSHCHNVAGCQIDKVRKIWYNIASPSNVTFIYDGTNVVAIYQSSNERSSVVTYVCEPETEPPILVAHGEVCLTVYGFTIISKTLCPQKEPFDWNNDIASPPLS